VERALRLAVACCYPDPRQRPSIRDAVQVLVVEVEVPEPPLVKLAFV
jgi:interleukin-1 receptor-associated kinase 1